MNNTGSAILIIGAIWLHFAYGFNIIASFMLVILGCFTMVMLDSKHNKQMKKVTETRMQLEIEKLQLEINKLKESKWA